ncbi:MAG: DUF3090 family protein [Actinobacteria bacterium]|nr:DUF3090 family protein [Actinomycetota bacterium]
MARIVSTFRMPERFVPGAVGEPGDREFFLQVKDGRRVVTLRFEKEQLEILASKLKQLVDGVSAPGAMTSHTDDYLDTEPLETPIEPEYSVGAMGLAFNPETAEYIVECHEMVADATDVPDIGSDAPEGPDTVRVVVNAEQAGSFIGRAFAVLAAGLPTCPFCYQSLEPQGHLCPRANGYRRSGAD